MHIQGHMPLSPSLVPAQPMGVRSPWPRVHLPPLAPKPRGLASGSLASAASPNPTCPTPWLPTRTDGPELGVLGVLGVHRIMHGVHMMHATVSMRLASCAPC